MEIFHELYGRYYQNMTRILLETPCTREVIRQIINEQGFEESLFFLMPKITKENEWNLLQEEDKLWYSKLLYEPYTPTTNLERRWMKAQLNDKRISMFLTDELRMKFLESLSEEKALYQKEDFYYFDQYLMGDPYEKESYQRAMRMVLYGLYHRAELEIVYLKNKDRREAPSKEQEKRGIEIHNCATVNGQDKETKRQENEKGERYLPLRLLYSMKEDCFRLYAVSLEQIPYQQITIFRMDRVIHVKILQDRKIPDIDVEQWMKKRKEEKPIVVRIKNEKKAVERFMIQMTDCEKETKEEEDQSVVVKIFYRQEQRQELVTRLLSIGPALEVLEPEEIREEIRGKIREQLSFMI